MENTFSKESVMLCLEEIQKDLLAIDHLLLGKKVSCNDLAKSHIEQLQNLEYKMNFLQEKMELGDSDERYVYSDKQMKQTMYLNLAK